MKAKGPLQREYRLNKVLPVLVSFLFFLLKTVNPKLGVDIIYEYEISLQVISRKANNELSLPLTLNFGGELLSLHRS